jgi:hypothetical protein
MDERFKRAFRRQLRLLGSNKALTKTTSGAKNEGVDMGHPSLIFEKMGVGLPANSCSEPSQIRTPITYRGANLALARPEQGTAQEAVMKGERTYKILPPDAIATA